MALASAVLFGLTALPAVSAWGNFGHWTIAYIAQDFVNAGTKSAVQSILGDTSTSYMANVATWADSYRETAAGAWSADLHFVDANDNPPTTCDVVFSRDCEDSDCVIGAITNYTNQLLSSSTSSAERVLALKFLIHFVGDVHQPLHDEALDVGGNTIDVTYSGKSTNLHAIWDTQILEQLAGQTTQTGARTYGTTETNDIKAGTWSTTSWLSGMDISNPQSSALVWANEANGFVCSDVIPDGVSAVETGDLSGAYYTAHVHAVRIQIARAGFRLASWLNLIFTGSTS